MRILYWDEHHRLLIYTDPLSVYYTGHGSIQTIGIHIELAQADYGILYLHNMFYVVKNRNSYSDTEHVKKLMFEAGIPVIEAKEQFPPSTLCHANSKAEFAFKLKYGVSQ